MSIFVDFITGMQIGGEYVFDPEEEINYLMFSFVIFRVTFYWDN